MLKSIYQEAYVWTILSKDGFLYIVKFRDRRVIVTTHRTWAETYARLLGQPYIPGLM